MSGLRPTCRRNTSRLIEQATLRTSKGNLFTSIDLATLHFVPTWCGLHHVVTTFFIHGHDSILPDVDVSATL